MTQNIDSLICNAVMHTATKLCKLRYRNETDNQPENGLIFPMYRKKKDDKPQIRVCEQEARIAFIFELANLIREQGYKLFYSVETPTRMPYYGFADSKVKPQVVIDDEDVGSSGSIDLSIYECADEHPSTNIEFKCGPSKQHDYEKDLLKLYMEPGEAVWIHIFDGDGNTKTTIENRFIDACKNLTDYCIKNKNISIYSIDLRGIKNTPSIPLHHYILTPDGMLEYKNS